MTLLLLFYILFTAILHYFKNTHFQNHEKAQEKFSSSLSEGLSGQYITNNKLRFTTYNEPDTVIKSAFTCEFTVITHTYLRGPVLLLLHFTEEKTKAQRCEITCQELY